MFFLKKYKNIWNYLFQMFYQATWIYGKSLFNYSSIVKNVMLFTQDSKSHEYFQLAIILVERYMHLYKWP